MTDSNGESRPNASHSERSESETTTKTRPKSLVSRRDTLATLLGLGGLGILGSETARSMPHGGGHGGQGNQPHTDVSDDGTKIIKDVDDINFGVNLSVTDDGDNTVTVDASPWEQATDAAGFSLSDLGGLTMSGGSEITEFTGSNLSIDGSGVLNATDTHTNISNQGSQILQDTKDINFGQNLDVNDDNDGSVTVHAVFEGVHDGDNIGSGVGVFAAKDGSTLLFRRLIGEGSIDVSRDGDTIKILGTDTHTNISDDGSQILENTVDINFGSNLDVTDDGDDTVTVDSTVSTSWADSDADDLLEPTGTATGIEGIGTIRSGGPLRIVVNDEDALVIAPPATAIGNPGTAVNSPNVIAGHPNNNTGGSSVRGTTIGGGGSSSYPNEASAAFASIGGGRGNTVNGPASTIGGGKHNTSTAQNTTIGGGEGNIVSNGFATVGGGQGNEAADNDTTIGGGKNNRALDGFATVAGGEDNEASSSGTSHAWSTVGGGRTNAASGQYATVPGGDHNTASGQYSFAAGREAAAQHDGAFVFGDSSSTGIQSQNADEVRSQMPMYAPAFNTTSARAKKEAIEPVTPEGVLDAVTDLEVSTWKLKHNSDGRHMGPMAEDFHDAFGLGDDDDHIASVDADGVLFAAVQGLSAKLDEKNDRIESLERDAAIKDDHIDELERKNETLRERYASLEKRLADLEAEITDADHN